LFFHEAFAAGGLEGQQNDVAKRTSFVSNGAICSLDTLCGGQDGNSPNMAPSGDNMP
jgi:hypothetical protein